MTDRTDEIRAAHDVLAEFYLERLAGSLEAMPEDRAVLGLFAEWVGRDHPGGTVGDVGCGTGRLMPYFARFGLRPRGVDLSPGMIRVARREQPEFDFSIADVRNLPFETGELSGAACWYSLMYLAPDQRAAAFAELARVIRPDGYLVTAFKRGHDELRRGGRSTGLGVEFDLYFLSVEEVRRHLQGAGFEVIFWAGRPAQGAESTPQAFLIARRRNG